MMNFGGILQACALQEVLRRMGHKPVTWRHSFYKDTPLRRWVEAVKVDVRSTLHYCDEDLQISKNTRPFIHKYLKEKNIRSFADVRRSDYDAIIVGSDQIWRNVFFKPTWGEEENIANAFLAFTEGWDVRRIAYAPSFGLDHLNEYTPEQLDECGRALRRFDFVSVREQSGVGLCKEAFGVDARWVIDPTMLLQTADYERLMGKVAKPGKPFMMSYVLDDSAQKSQLCELLARDRNLVIRRSNGKFDDWLLPIEERIQPPVEEWLGNFRESDFVFTDSFHACVFSILFHKQFAVVGNRGRGMSRFVSLLGMFGLEGRMVESEADCKALPEIDYTQVDAVLEQKRAEGWEFLKRALA